ncbi:hypothetical protein [Hymenobacter cellulosilyticus]|uniref:Uncharacterized protein n=1 Tax=Hymenobacter cellulosilyticus TaxID=2932248 RepID=A0A8T9Q6N7_9BACT|nr:hypothetical protein [Hymenobacter cellulosilyticus]UOQ71430.1 hypothetical protein MUN79_22840 [Hymenobacter cellulosilyticus]
MPVCLPAHAAPAPLLYPRYGLDPAGCVSERAAGALGRLGPSAPDQDHLHLPGMPQAHHHHLEEHTRADACARQPVKQPTAQHAHAGSGEQQLTSLAPLVLKLLGSAAVLPTEPAEAVAALRPWPGPGPRRWPWCRPLTCPQDSRSAHFSGFPADLTPRFR